MAPAGRGSAEQWVRENFARQVGKFRARNAKASSVMFVLRDADRKTVQERFDDLDEALCSAGLAKIDPEREAVARLVPKRNIETWILCLSNHSGLLAVDEEQDYKNTQDDNGWSALIPQSAESFLSWTQRTGDLPDAMLNSVKTGIREAHRTLQGLD